MKNTKKKKLIIAFIVCLVVIGICLHTRHIWEKNAQVKELETEQISPKMQGLSTQTNETEDLKPLSAEELNNPIKVTALPTTYSAQTKQTGKLTYLSDIPRMSKSTTRYGSILNDKTQNNAKITVKLGGTATSFDKGIWAHATSDLYYDLRNFQEYEYFSAYLGLNVTSNNGNGVTFIISTSNDGQNWTEKYRTQALPSQNATECRVPIKGYRYLRLYASDNGANGSDHSVYADAKLLTADYSDGTGIPTMFELDEQIKNTDENAPNLEYMVLQREFISRVGRTTLINFINEGEANKETLNWLMGDVDTLGLYFYGSTPIGGYKNSLSVLTRLYQTYKNDLNDTTVKNGIQNGYLYKKMIMALSHTHSTIVRSFMPNAGEDGYDTSGLNDPSNPMVSDAVKRYAVYKKMYLANKLSATFPKLEVEEMKGVMKALIQDNEIEWLRDYVQQRRIQC